MSRSFRAQVNDGIVCWFASYNEAAKWVSSWPSAIEAHITSELEIDTKKERRDNDQKTVASFLGEELAEEVFSTP